MIPTTHNTNIIENIIGEGSNFHFFYPNQENTDIINNILNYDSRNTCMGKIKHDWKIRSLNKYSFGIISYDVNKVLTISEGKPIFDIKGYIICKIYDKNPNIMYIDLVCSRNSIGKKLVRIAEERINLVPNITTIALKPISTNLIKWYKSMNYIIVGEKSKYTKQNFNNLSITMEKIIK